MPEKVDLTYSRFLGFAALAAMVVLALLLVGRLGDLLLMAFGAVLFALLLHVASEPFQRFTPLPRWAALLLAALLLAGVLGATVWLFGTRIATEFSGVLDHVRAGLDQVRATLGRSEFGRFMLQQAQGAHVSLTSVLETAMSVLVNALKALIVIVISGGYLAADPESYRDGAVRLFPQRRQRWARETLDAIGQSLRFWLLGQLIEMGVIGVLSGCAAFMIGLPSPIALGLIAGVAEFTPYLGPLVAAVPALLVALTRGPSETLWTLAAYLLIHQIEGNLVMPLIQRRMIRTPPAVMLLGIAAMGALAGLIGYIFAAPAVVTACVLVQKAYMRDVLHEATVLPSEKPAPSPEYP